MIFFSYYYYARKKAMQDATDLWKPREDGSTPALDGMTASEAMWAMVNEYPDLYSDDELFADDGDTAEE